ncbi:type IV secretion system DNA-binding domain-containing protein [Ruficoccus amylovorans]|uniref:Type IV secretion system DNA-binding domain-containing protein n=1 Tax=Ruficoccus amylovorans TaxID=1804625 RepID=A0A842HCT1_9BACT|nr:type IV secretion system DNA-binding domain-containing protein [Ruficoccus amylovorans]
MTGTQSTQSLVPPMGADKAKVFIANMANRVIFKAADEESAKTAADCLGKHEVWRKSHGVSGGKRSFNKHREDRYYVQPHEFPQAAEIRVRPPALRRPLAETNPPAHRPRRPSLRVVVQSETATLNQQQARPRGRPAYGHFCRSRQASARPG